MPQYKLPSKFQLENGEILENAHLYYEVLGDPSNEPVWICHALTGSATVKEWWPTLFKENGGFLDEKEHFIICANTLGSCYGSSGPENYQDEFPKISHRDIVNAFQSLKTHLNVDKIGHLIGGSLGGQQALEWAIQFPDTIERLVLIATNASHSSWGKAWNHLQREALTHPNAEKGLALARQIAMLSYRNFADFQGKEVQWAKSINHNVTSYMVYQGDKFVHRFNKDSYSLLSILMDEHDIGRGRVGGIDEILKKVKANTLIVGIDSDILFPLSEQRLLANEIPNAHLKIINSDKGHDAFLLEGNLISNFIENHYKKEFLCEK